MGNKETKIWLRKTTTTVSQHWWVPEIPGPIQMRPSRRASMSAESFVLFLKGADPKCAKNVQKPNFWPLNPIGTCRDYHNQRLRNWQRVHRIHSGCIGCTRIRGLVHQGLSALAGLLVPPWKVYNVCSGVLRNCIGCAPIASSLQKHRASIKAYCEHVLWIIRKCSKYTRF